MATAPLLNIDTLSEHPTIMIDGTAYELLLPDALPVLDYLRTDSLRKRFAAACATPDGSTNYAPEASVEIDNVLGELVRIVLKAPDAVQARLNSSHKLSIYHSFMQQQHASGPLSQSKTKPEAGRKKSKKASGRRSIGAH